MLAIAVVGVIALWRLRRPPSWLGPAIAASGAGALAGQVVTLFASGHVAVGWGGPIFCAAVLVAAAPVAFLFARRLREPFAAQSG